MFIAPSVAASTCYLVLPKCVLPPAHISKNPPAILFVLKLYPPYIYDFWPSVSEKGGFNDSQFGKRDADVTAGLNPPLDRQCDDNEKRKRAYDHRFAEKERKDAGSVPLYPSDDPYAKNNRNFGLCHRFKRTALTQSAIVCTPVAKRFLGSQDAAWHDYRENKSF